MYNEIVEIKTNDGIRYLVSSKTYWTDLEVIAQARLAWGWGDYQIIQRVAI